MARSRLALLVVFGLSSVACATSQWPTTASAPRLPGSGMDAPAPRDAVTQQRPTDPPADFSIEERHRIAYVQPWVTTAAKQHSINANLINAMIWVESRFQPRAKSPAGARGLMQLMPSTASALAQSMGKFRASPYDPEFNIAAGSLYLRKMLERYHGDVRLALAAYNAGAGNVDKWIHGSGLPPYSEEYVRLVMDAKKRFDAWHKLEPVVPSATMIATKEPGPREPEDIVPDPPVRYDLDKVESTYVPEPEPEPVAESESEPESDPEPESDLVPEPGRLPSVLD